MGAPDPRRCDRSGTLIRHAASHATPAIGTPTIAMGRWPSDVLRNPNQETAAYAERVFVPRPKFVFVARFEIPPESMLSG
jgi:hypothetical protein